MKKYLVAALLVAAYAGPALAEEFYVAFDPASHKCTMMQSQPAAPMKSMGSFKTEAASTKAMAGMKECQGQSLLGYQELWKGASSKEIAHMLGVSPRTGECHRANIMKKYDAKNLADLVCKFMTEDRRQA